MLKPISLKSFESYTLLPVCPFTLKILHYQIRTGRPGPRIPIEIPRGHKVRNTWKKLEKDANKLAKNQEKLLKHEIEQENFGKNERQLRLMRPVEAKKIL